jgi:hypothetical protein
MANMEARLLGPRVDSKLAAAAHAGEQFAQTRLRRICTEADRLQPNADVVFHSAGRRLAINNRSALMVHCIGKCDAVFDVRCAVQSGERRAMCDAKFSSPSCGREGGLPRLSAWLQCLQFAPRAYAPTFVGWDPEPSPCPST